jgi:4-hydroxy-tetrahydrodipicolinate synthase
MFLKEFPKLNMRTGTSNNLKAALNAGMGAILADGNLFAKPCAAVFTAHRQNKDVDAALKNLRDTEALLRAGGVGSYGPMKYALSLLMGNRQTFQRPPHLDVTDAQKEAIKTGVDQIKKMA